MIKVYLHRILWMLGLAFLQALVLNNIHIAGYATPFLYIYLILKFDITKGRNEQMIWAFALGLLVDMFSDTPGMNASACTLLAFVRPTLLRLFTSRDAFENMLPSSRSMGTGGFFKYVLAATALHHTLLFILEYFSFNHPLDLLWRLICSTALTILLIFALEGIRKGD